MAVSFTRVTPADAEGIIDFLSSNAFPFHVKATQTAEEAASSVRAGRFWNPESQGYWIDDDGARLGMVVLEDLEDPTPMFDLRLAEACRGQGKGADVLRALCGLVFTSLPEALRFEGQTREDNIAMRKTFIRCGFLKEAHYRLGWPTADGGHVASVAYAMLRQDWSSGTVTGFEWEDLRA
ncbi:GNAT family N-acetyltransferase [Arthrobacter sp. H5]|uniref:GNAT family N-acetyltransferase n=1 Tax=Arthrobacter sp. H5 TaxID=1267973 RepID=UPI0004807144|nr:GNAT family N-acetyltransferase [Arthrobacter sp. H5]